jgi:hypothetical protein
MVINLWTSGASQTRLALFESLVKFRRPGDGVGALDSGAGENILQWCLGGSRVGQKPSIARLDWWPWKGSYLCPKNVGELRPQMAGFGGRRLGSRPSFSVLTGQCGLGQSW